MKEVLWKARLSQPWSSENFVTTLPWRDHEDATFPSHILLLREYRNVYPCEVIGAASLYFHLRCFFRINHRNDETGDIENCFSTKSKTAKFCNKHLEIFFKYNLEMSRIFIITHHNQSWEVMYYL